MTHSEKHDLAGKTVTIKSGEFAGQPYRLKDWWDRVAGKSWMDCEDNPACLEYAMRSADERTPMNNDVVYGKIGAFDKLIHANDLGDIVE